LAGAALLTFLLWLAHHITGAQQMASSLKPLAQQVMVITGASSGIGLATAQDAGQRGRAHLWLRQRQGRQVERQVNTGRMDCHGRRMRA